MAIPTTLTLLSIILTAPACSAEATAPSPAVLQEIPSAVAGIELGRPLDPDAERHLYDIAALGFVGYVTAVVSGPGVVTHLIVEPLIIEGDPEENYITDDFDQVVDVLESAYGPATIEDDSWDRAAVWQAEDRRLTAEWIEPPGEMSYVRITLRTEDPTRICGPEDGFTEWINGLTYAVVDGDAEAAAQYFQFPFADVHARVMSGGAYERGELDDSALEFETAEDFIKRFPALNAEGTFDDIGPRWLECDPLRGHIVWLDHLPMQVQWVDGELRAVAITYFP